MAARPLAGKDTTTVKYTLTATADTSGWTIEFPTGVKAPLQVMLAGDSVMVKTGEFASQRRKNVKVWNDGWVRLERRQTRRRWNRALRGRGRGFSAEAKDRRNEGAD